MSLETFPPYVLISARFLLSGSIMIAGSLARGARLPRGTDLWKAGLSGVLILSVGNGCLTFAELQIASGLASLIITLSPFWLVGIEAMAPGGEPLHLPTVFGMSVGFAGAAREASAAQRSVGFCCCKWGWFRGRPARSISGGSRRIRTPS
jgi:drug/metabolite transporter (DMT)-like permease